MYIFDLFNRNQLTMKMRLLFSALMVTVLTTILHAQNDNKAAIDSLENTFKYQHGKVKLKNGIGEITVPKGFKYLDPEQSKHVIVDIWGNPDSENISLGMILPEKQGVLDDRGYVFNIQYDEIGYVKDDDADDINYDDLLAEMQKDTEEENKERNKQGYDPIQLVGWASNPFYDKEHKILHWAQELKFGTNKVNTLNYNVRILGRKGVLVLNAISSMQELPLVKKDIHNVLNIVTFNDGYKYSDFDPSVDQVAAWTIGGLVAGKVLAKVGFFAIIAKFGKVIAIAVGGFFTAMWRRMRGRKKEEESDNNDTPAIEPTSET